MVNTVWVNAGHGHNFHPLANHVTKVKKFTKEENEIFQHFDFTVKCLNKRQRIQ